MNRRPLLALCSLVFFFGCHKNTANDTPANGALDYKQEIRNFVIGISQYAKKINGNFKIIPQNGIELVTTDGKSNGAPATDYLAAIDGNGQEDLNYGYSSDNVATDKTTTDYLNGYLSIAQKSGKTILVTDYCATQSNMTDSYAKNSANAYISFAADQRDLGNIPTFPSPVYNENANVITQLSQAKNFLYLINTANFTDKTAFINKVKATNYDVLIMDLYQNEGDAFTAADIAALRNKANGGKRLVICYVSIGEAENYRYYWQTGWKPGQPSWLDAVNPDWPGNYKVKYWNKDWQNIIYGNDGSYLKKVLDAGFDGAYLDIIDAFQYYE